MKFKFGLLMMMGSVFLWSGCGDSGTNSGQTGTLKMSMTDAPARFEAVTITFAEIDANIGGEWHTIQGDAQTVDLLTLNNGTSIVVGQADVPAGNYSQIRLKIDHAEVKVGGQTYTLTVPSGDQSGYKLNTDFTVSAGSTYEMMLDFDANRSIVSAGSSGQFILKPTVRAVPVAITGSISGTVSSTINAPLAFALTGTDTVTSTVVDTTSGNFKLSYLPPGDYTVVVEDTTGAAAVNSNVAVEAGADNSLGTLTLQLGVLVGQ